MAKIRPHTFEDQKRVYDSLDPLTNTYIPLSGGTESLANLVYCDYDPDCINMGGHWFMPQAGHFGEAMWIYSQKQAEYFNLPLTEAHSTVPVNRQVVSPIITGLSSVMELIVGQHVPLKWFIVSGSAEDDMRWRLQFREYRKIMANYLSDCLDSSGVELSALVTVPEIRNPLEFLTKAELIALIARKDKELLDLIWTCPYPKKKGPDYIPCRRCNKCSELENAKKLAQDAVFRYQEGKRFLSALR